MAELNLSDIVRWEIKEDLSFKERNNIISLAISLVDGNSNNDGLFKNVAIDVASTVGATNFYDKDDNLLGEELNDLTLDELYELVKKVDVFNNASKSLSYCLEDIRKSLLANYEDIKVEKSLTSKYDEILTNILHLVELLLEDFNEADISNVSKQVSLLSKKLGSVTEETLIQTILKNMKKEDVN